MMRWVPWLLIAGCASENPDMVVERQPAPLADVTDTAWTPGSVIVVAEAGALTFPQVLSLRMTIVDDAAAEVPIRQSIAMAKVAPYGTGQLEVTTEPSCHEMACTAEVSVGAMGESMLAITAQGPAGEERRCFYYAVVEAGTDTDALRADLETQQRDCRFAAQ